jgi:DNA-binding transcriptional ArsR family regulator
MTKPPHHPETAEIELSAVLDALSDPVRRAVVVQLAREGEQSCSAFAGHGSKTSLAYHYARLREAGVTRTRCEGARRMVSLRTDDLEARFPGLLRAVLAAEGVGG